MDNISISLRFAYQTMCYNFQCIKLEEKMEGISIATAKCWKIVRMRMPLQGGLHYMAKTPKAMIYSLW